MKKIFGLVVFMMLLSAVAQGKNIYLIRHAEKVDDGSKDPVLTVQGQLRADNIADMLSQANIQHVYATDYQRTQLTAKPLADFLGTTVTSYDPSQLPAFAETLKQQTGNVLVVGHSNTTPMLTYLLSGKPVINLDETDFDNVFQVILDGEEANLNVLKSSPSKATQSLTQFKPMNDHFFNGELNFNMLFKDEVVGTSTHSFKQVDQTYELTEKAVIEKMNIDADIKVSVDLKNMAPLNLSMSGTMASPVDIQLNWKGLEVKGHSNMARAPFKQQGKIELNQELRPTSLERTSTIMLAHLMPVAQEPPTSSARGPSHRLEASAGAVFCSCSSGK